MKNNIRKNILQTLSESEASSPNSTRLKPSVPNSSRGIAMVELIFALVIMGIVLLSAPSLIHQSVQSSNVALQQESIAALATHMGIVISKHWDEADTNCTEAPILALTLNSSELNIANRGPTPRAPINENTRAGMENVVGRNSALTNGNIQFASNGAFGATADSDEDGKTFDDVDDYHNSQTQLTLTATSPTGDYIDRDITISTEVTYAKDIPTTGLQDNTQLDNYFNQTVGGERHIKFVSARLTTTSDVNELDKNITMSSFSCNIGTYQPGWEYK